MAGTESEASRVVGSKGQAVTQAERAIIDAITGMLARPDFLIPIVAAERQFRDHYYGLNSAALLEDLFFDALGNFLRQTEPGTRLVRPPTGQKGWDYTFNGLNVSHKVSQQVDVVAAIWDATLQGITNWSFNDPIVYGLSGNAPATHVRFEAGPVSLTCRALADLKRPFLADGRLLLIVRWPALGGQAGLLGLRVTERDQPVHDALPFSQVWEHVADHVRLGGRANDIDVLVSNGRPSREIAAALEALGSPCSADISVPFRAGIHLFPKSLLQDLPVTTNNRGVLIPKPVVQQLLLEARELGLVAGLPLWYTAYAQERPPDMYSSQRSEYDARFSARGELDT